MKPIFIVAVFLVSLGLRICACEPDVELRLQTYHELIYARTASGEEIRLDISNPSSPAAKALNQLNYSVCLAQDPHRDASAIYLKGRLENSVPGIIAQSNTHGTPSHFRFHLTSWRVSVPYREYIQGEADAPPTIVERTTLRRSDFEPPFPRVLITAAGNAYIVTASPVRPRLHR